MDDQIYELLFYGGVLLLILAAVVAVARGMARRPRCPECGKVVVKGARRCSHCASPLK